MRWLLFLPAIVIFLLPVMNVIVQYIKQNKSFQISVSTQMIPDIDSSNDRRMLDGVPLRTQDDWTQWWVWKGYVDGLSEHLTELEQRMIAMDCDDPVSLLEEWHMYYNRMRRVCSRHGIWNVCLHDYEPFVPTSNQLALEKNVFASLEKAISDTEEQRKKYTLYSGKIYQYLLEQKRHMGNRNDAIKAIGGTDKNTRADVRRVYRQMLKNHSLIEKEDVSHVIIFRKPPARKADEFQFSTHPSMYSKSLYEAVPTRTEYKALITVGEPVDLNRDMNCCRFISKSSGRIYCTTLEECTCPAFADRCLVPCKHMVKLASALHLYTIRVHAKIEYEPTSAVHPSCLICAEESAQRDKENNASEMENQEIHTLAKIKEDNMIATKPDVLYNALIQHLSDIGAEYIDKTSQGGGLYFFDESVANELKSKGYEPRFAKNGTKGTGHRPAWYVRYK